MGGTILPISAAQGTLTFNSFYDPTQLAKTTWTGTAYPEIVYAIRGNYNFNLPTDHILVRASTVQYEGSAVGDTLVFNWKQYFQNYPKWHFTFWIIRTCNQ